jgi:hypothetical protein
MEREADNPRDYCAEVRKVVDAPTFTHMPQGIQHLAPVRHFADGFGNIIYL